jgi:Hypoxia induced protein conserved region
MIARTCVGSSWKARIQAGQQSWPEQHDVAPGLRAGSAWLGAVALSFGVQMFQNTPWTLKIFQTRIYAQAVTLGALCGAAYITLSDDEDKRKVSVKFYTSCPKL